MSALNTGGLNHSTSTVFLATLALGQACVPTILEIKTKEKGPQHTRALHSIQLTQDLGFRDSSLQAVS